LTSLVGNITLLVINFNENKPMVLVEFERRLHDIRVLTFTVTYTVAFSHTGMSMALSVRARVANGTFLAASFSQFLFTTHNPEMNR
jgi:hypothetical protein